MLTSYASQLSARPGERVTVHASAWPAAGVRARVLRLAHDGDVPIGPDLHAAAIGVDLGAATVDARTTIGGSHAIAPLEEPMALDAGVTFEVWVRVTALAAREQTLLTAEGVPLALRLDAAGRVRWEAGDASVVGPPLRQHAWHRLAASTDAAGRIRLVQECVEPLASSIDVIEGASELTSAGQISRIGLATDLRGGGTFTGKLARLSLHRGVHDAPMPEDAAARWSPQELHRHQAPTPSVTGPGWTSASVSPRADPHAYDALHFAADQLDDARWPSSFTWAVAEGQPGGLYFIELESHDERDLLPLVITAPPAHEVTVLMPTFTYLAYANERLGRDMVERNEGWWPPMDHRDAELSEHPEWGRSQYDTHDDGVAVRYSSHLRPIPNLRPDYRCWFVDGARHLGADARLLQWLQRERIAFDVLSDHALDDAGPGALDPRTVVITGSHPEYVSARMRAALERHQRDGGRLMYLGGNGFYWVTGRAATTRWRTEVRRGLKGATEWESAAGEQHLASTGEPGGLWRQRGAPPNALAGIGFAAQGWDGRSLAYRRTAEARGVEWAWVFEGLDPDAPIGATGRCMGGAAGDEIDRADPDRGTPPETTVLATASGFSDAYQLVVEDVPEMHAHTGGQASPLVRADLAITQRAGGGAVFAVGSIAWIAALGVDGAVTTITRNVLRAFASPPTR